jgi:hypothetical protein
VVIFSEQWQMSFTSGLVSTVIGVILGLPIALLIDRLIKKQQNKSNKKFMIKTLSSSILKNIQILEQIRSDLDKSLISFYTVDIVVLESLSKDYHSYFDNNTSNEIDYCRCELTLLSRKLNSLYSQYTYLLNGAMNGYTLHTIGSSIKEQSKELLPRLKELQLKFNNGIYRK